jgi:hypothetical protein
MDLKSFTIVERMLTKAEAEATVEAVKYTPNIIGYTAEELMLACNTLVAENSIGEMVGTCVCHNVSKNWIKISLLFVFDTHRQQGIGGNLFRESCRAATELKQNIYTSSRNPTVIRLMKELDFQIFNKLDNLLRDSKNYRTMFLTHYTKWFLNPYRMQELIRKKYKYKQGERSGFIHGIKVNSPSF